MVVTGPSGVIKTGVYCPSSTAVAAFGSDSGYQGKAEG
jgi:hypothetical protein